MPTAMPLPFEGGPYLVTQGFNTSVSHSGPLRWGVDFGTPYGTPIRSVLDGEIVAFRQDAPESFITDAPSIPVGGFLVACAVSGHSNYSLIRNGLSHLDLLESLHELDEVLAPHMLSEVKRETDTSRQSEPILIAHAGISCGGRAAKGKVPQHTSLL